MIGRKQNELEIAVSLEHSRFRCKFDWWLPSFVNQSTLQSRIVQSEINENYFWATFYGTVTNFNLKSTTESENCIKLYSKLHF